MGVSEASVRDELLQLESELIGNELVMRQAGLGRIGLMHPTAQAVTRPGRRRDLASTSQALGVRPARPA